MSNALYKDMSFLNSMTPFTGIRTADFMAVIPDNSRTRPFFDGNPKYEQITGITLEKPYRITAVEGYGDAVDFILTDDNGKETRLGSWFFQSANKN